MGNAIPLAHVVAPNEQHATMSGCWWPAASQYILTLSTISVLSCDNLNTFPNEVIHNVMFNKFIPD